MGECAELKVKNKIIKILSLIKKRTFPPKNKTNLYIFFNRASDFTMGNGIITFISPLPQVN